MPCSEAQPTDVSLHPNIIFVAASYVYKELKDSYSSLGGFPNTLISLPFPRGRVLKSQSLRTVGSLLWAVSFGQEEMMWAWNWPIFSFSWVHDFGCTLTKREVRVETSGKRTKSHDFRSWITGEKCLYSSLMTHPSASGMTPDKDMGSKSRLEIKYISSVALPQESVAMVSSWSGTRGSLS